MDRLRSLCLLSVLLLLLLSPTRIGAQESAAAVITFPRQGQPILGTVGITGAAVHPQFDRYELAFAYDPDPTGTWFPIGDPGKTPVEGSELASWDVSGITDGRYALRLRVFGQDGSFLESLVGGVVIQNNTPTATPLPEPPTPTEPAPESSPTPTLPPLVDQPATATPRPTSPVLGAPSEPAVDQGDFPGAFLAPQELRRSFCTGAGWTFIFFAVIGLYAALRTLLRPHLRRWLRQTLENLQR